ncbi:protein-export membrane protein SecF [Tepidanaerobacter syntrophicus]|uniref:protein translocase subunit SecF n=1 Tax=Tepidanaerobacter syntrophicus TaxID=224999 RepID=UPI0022EDDE38|nr:protein translocase subunit SecF [Tepidanaerobacter syntrophicus]GLI50075.1 protein-export membrane protein SecF [Tepidanaerobacter syntrophicus]
MKAYKIIEKKYLWFGLSLAVIIIGIAFLIFQGFNWGIDFTGGNMLQFDIHQSFELTDARSILEQLDIREFEVKKGGDTQQELIIKTTAISEDMQNKISESLKQKWPNTELIQAETIDAVIGKEMRQQAIIALILANIGMLIYITFRFEFKSAVAAVLALVHDVLIIISFYAIFHIPVDSTFIAVVLTIVGYSINDTIVVFDRIRENLKTMKKISFTEIADLSITQTLARSINTSLTTLITITALFLLGGETIKDFSLALIIGIASGTYSSIFIATPLWEIFRDRTKTVKA